MPLIARRWYDIPLRASLVATLVATVVTASGWVGPKISGIIALFPIVFTSMMLILHPRIGGPPTAAVIANSAGGLMGLGIAIAMINVAALRFGSAIGLSIALAICVELESRAVVVEPAEGALARRSVARMERSVIRAEASVPDCAALHPGYGRGFASTVRKIDSYRCRQTR